MTDVAPFDDARAKSNALVLALAQALYGATTTAILVTGGLVGTQLSPSAFWATLPQSMMIIGTAFSTFPISLLMRHIGRRAGFMGAALVGAAGAVLGLLAIYQRSFVMFLLGCLIIGIYNASASYYRFAAADTASPAFRPKAVSWVMTGGVIAALVGSLVVMGTVDLFAPVTFAGTWAAMALLALAGAGVLSFVNIPKPAQTSSGTGRSLMEIARQPAYITATVVTMITFGVMVLVMVATPVAMLGCGFTVTDSSWVIQWHALAMFVPSFFTGHLITRFGSLKIITVGLLLLMAAGIAALMGITFGNFAVGLILLGLGWNFGFIGGTTLLTTTYRPEERNKAQGFSDLLTFVTTAITSLSAGGLMATIGWNAVNYAVFPLTLAGLAIVAWLATRTGRVAI